MKNQQPETLRAGLAARRDKLLAKFQEAVQKHDRPRMHQLSLQLTHATELIDTFDWASTHRTPEGPRYVVSALFLAETFRVLTADRDEQLNTAS